MNTKEMMLIAEQQLKISDMEKLINKYQTNFKSIYYLLYNVGAPLNDNLYKYNREQLKVFFDIAEIIREDIDNN